MFINDYVIICFHIGVILQMLNGEIRNKLGIINTYTTAKKIYFHNNPSKKKHK